jgi:hypothetical protein
MPSVSAVLVAALETASLTVATMDFRFLGVLGLAWARALVVDRDLVLELRAALVRDVVDFRTFDRDDFVVFRDLVGDLVRVLFAVLFGEPRDLRFVAFRMTPLHQT